MSAQPSLFDRIVSGDDVEQWTLDVLKKWSGTYLSELERQNGLEAGKLQRVRAWVTAGTFDKWPEDQLPAVLLVSAGLLSPPTRRGDGSFDGRWGMGIGCICSAGNQEATHAQALIYLAAHRAILLQRPSLEQHAAGLTWLDEDYTQIEYDDLRTLGAALASFSVQVNGITNAHAGPTTPGDPLDPETDPWPVDPVVATVDVQVTEEGGT